MTPAIYQRDPILPNTVYSVVELDSDFKFIRWVHRDAFVFKHLAESICKTIESQNSNTKLKYKVIEFNLRTTLAI